MFCFHHGFGAETAHIRCYNIYVLSFPFD
uniref:Uncharacterized protein n=1 Tax=Rhizophora mucronata TaxID=61149 RepID=A0A2P2QC43_RHIMU